LETIQLLINHPAAGKHPAAVNNSDGNPPSSVNHHTVDHSAIDTNQLLEINQLLVNIQLL
jgi:hypothetical protein